MRPLATLLFLTALPALHAQQPNQPAATHFAPLEFLVGNCWMGTFPDGKQTDEHCFEWVFDQKFIRDRHVVRGGEPYQGESLYRWDAEKKQLSYWYWSSAGLVVTGTVENTPRGIVFPSRYSTPKGEVEIEAVWTRLGADAYRVSQRQRAGGDTAWKPLWAMELKRQRR